MAEAEVSAYHCGMMPIVSIRSSNLVGAACGIAMGTLAFSQGQWWWAALWTVLTPILIAEGLWRARKARV